VNDLDLRDLVSDEPPFVLRADEAVASGKRRVRHRRFAASASALGLVGAVAAGAALLQPASPTTSLQVGAPGTASDTGELTSDVYLTVRAHTPDAWRITDARTDRGGSWFANVDDGEGAGRLYVGYSPHPGSLQQHPCSDPEFARGTTCTETQLDTDRRLVVSEVPASVDNGYPSRHAVIIHVDGGGTYVESDNATWPVIDLPPGTRVTPEEKRRMSLGTINRPQPTYSTDQLVELVTALDALR
jgi:hypothetical protein